MGGVEGRRRIVGSHNGAPTYINLKIKSPNGHEVYFNVMRSSELRRVMIVSCDRLSLEVNDIRFVYKGHYVLAEETPDQLRMEDGDVIDAISVQPHKINVTVNGEFTENQNIVCFRIKKGTQLKRLMTAYCDRYSLHVTCFAFLWNGRRLRYDQTPDELKMEDGEEIFAMPHLPRCENCRQLQ
ncbi:hypothetical protein ABKV19_004721 [Rosa sericea]